MEEKPMNVTPDQISVYFTTLERAIQNVSTALVLNLDESGLQRLADARHETVIPQKWPVRVIHPIFGARVGMTHVERDRKLFFVQMKEFAISTQELLHSLLLPDELLYFLVA